MELDTVTHADALEYCQILPDECVNSIITSVPYWGLRSYLAADDPLKAQEMGNEPTPEEYVNSPVTLFRESRRVLRNDGTLWINVADTYASSWSSGRNNGRGLGSRDNRINRISGDLKEKDLCGIPWLLAFGLRHDGWYLRRDIIWSKGISGLDAAMDRPRSGHEYIFMFSKAWRPYYFDFAALPHAFRGSVWQVSRTGKKRSNHSATFPDGLVQPMVLAACPPGGVVMDPFVGSGTTCFVARSLGRHYLGCDLSKPYISQTQAALNLPYTPPMFA